MKSVKIAIGGASVVFVYNAQYADVDFKTLSDRYTNRRMVPFLTHIDGDRANLFSINPRQIMTPTMVNQHLFFVFVFTP